MFSEEAHRPSLFLDEGASNDDDMISYRLMMFEGVETTT
jgi:hypothetical protein